MLPLHQPGTLSCRFGLTSVSAGEGLRLTVTVRAQHPKVLQAVIVRDTVAVIELDGQGLPPPLGQAALVADVFEYTSLKQAPFDGASIAAAGEQFLDRPALRTRANRPAADGLCPRGKREAEPLDAPTNRPSLVIVSLDLHPIVARRGGRRPELAAADRLIPSGELEAEVAAAGVAVMAGIVVGLDGRPIVTESHLERVAEGRATGVART
jgi:hypothetical protein